jgi:hypothetical protein
MIDFSTEFGSRVARQLKSEQIIWLTTVDSGWIRRNAVASLPRHTTNRLIPHASSSKSRNAQD